MENGNNRDGSPESPAIHRSRSHSHQRSRKQKSKSRSRSREHRRKRTGSESPTRRSHYQPSGYHGSSQYSRGYSGSGDFRGASRYGGYNGRYNARPSGRYNGDHNGHANRETPPEGRCLGVFGLHVDTSEKKLKNVFEEFGGLEDIQMVFDAKTGRSRGFAFIYFETVQSAKHAKEKLNGIEIDSRKIRVDFSLTQQPHTPTPGIYMGRNGSRSRSNYYGGGGGGGGHNSRYNDYPPRDYDYHSRDRAYPPVKSRRYSRSRSRSPRKAGYSSYAEDKSFRRGHYPSTGYEEKYSSSRY